jgi:uncharacterized protein YqeY
MQRLGGTFLVIKRSFSSPNLKEVIKNDLKASMISKDAKKSVVLKSILSELINVDKSNNNPDSLHVSYFNALQKMVKKRKDSIDQFSKGGRNDLVEVEQEELKIVLHYMPSLMTEKEIRSEILKGLNKIEKPWNIGKIMKEIKLDPLRAPKHLVSKVSKEILVNKDSNS